MIPALVFSGVDSLKIELNRTKTDKERVSLLMQIGDEHAIRDSSHYYWEQGIVLAHKISWHFGAGELYRSKALNNSYFSQMDSAVFYWRLSKLAYLQEFNQNGLPRNELAIANVDYNMAIDMYLSEQYFEAVKQLQLALEIYRKHKDNIGINDCYNILGDIYYQQQDYERAIIHFDEAIIYANEIKDSQRLKIAYNNKASVQLSLGEYEESLTNFKLALEYLEEGNLWGLHEIKMNMAQSQIFLKEFDKAKISLVAGVKHFKQSKNYRDVIIAQNYILHMHASQQNWQQIIPIAKDNLNRLEDYTFLGQKKETYKYLSLAYEAIGSIELALIYHKKFTSVKDSLFNQGKNKEIERLKTQLEFSKKEQQISELTEENLIKEASLTKERNRRNVILFTACILVLIFVSFWIQRRRREDKARYKIEMKKMEIEQRMLRSQMNPHFIFNALNSIQSYIAINDTYQAEVFLSKFSTLIRNILELSMNEYISIDKEIDTLQLYMELEKLRFNDKFDFKIDDQLTDSTFKVPPMLIQPFVENAIIHGMKGKTDKGKIEVQFSELNDDMILCVVDDDGVGRINSNNIRKNHRSLATQLIDDRIDFFNKKSNHQFDIKIVDKIGENGNAIGTRVELLIPII